ncbi:MAG: recombination protein RecR, partial [Candidatus Brocadiia bacterium]|nr:recombination protein RecR [Candidatus Brocadiia bacterium]
MGKIYSESVARLTTRLAGMPGVGEKTAERLAYHIREMSRKDALELAEAIRDVKDNVKKCSVCCLLSENDPC